MSLIAHDLLVDPLLLLHLDILLPLMLLNSEVIAY